MTGREVKPIRICFVILNAYPLFNPEAKGVIGGAEVDSYYIASELAKDPNYRVSCIVADYGQEPVEVRESVTLIKALDFNTGRFAATLRLWQALRKADAQIYVRKLSSAVTSVVALFCKRYGRRFVYRTASAVECDGTYLREHYFRGKGFLWSLRHAEAVIAQNQTDADNLVKTAGVRAKVIRNPERLPPLDEKERRTILWVGRSADVKRPDLFLELAKKIPEQHFTMICQRAIEDKKYDSFVAKAKQIKNIELTQRVPFHQIHEHFLQAKVFVNTSDYEGFPNTFIQACKCATPILSLNVNPDGFLDEHKCGICCKGDWEKFVDSLKGMLQHEKCSELGNNARKYVEKNHDITKIVEQYKSCFTQIIQNKI